MESLAEKCLGDTEVQVHAKHRLTENLAVKNMSEMEVQVRNTYVQETGRQKTWLKRVSVTQKHR